MLILSKCFKRSLVHSISCALQLHPILLINNHQTLNTVPIQHLRINHKIRQYHRLLSLTRIITDLVMASRHLMECASRVEDLHRIVVHFVQHAAFEHDDGDKGSGVCMRWCGAIWWEGHLRDLGVSTPDMEELSVKIVSHARSTLKSNQHAGILL